MAGNPRFGPGEEVLCYDGSLVYEARVEKFEWRGSEFWYYIHYKNWKKSWDEWVREGSLLPFSEENLDFQRTALLKHEVNLTKKHISRYYLGKAGDKSSKYDSSDEKGSLSSDEGGKVVRSGPRTCASPSSSPGAAAKSHSAISSAPAARKPSSLPSSPVKNPPPPPPAISPRSSPSVVLSPIRDGLPRTSHISVLQVKVDRLADTSTGAGASGSSPSAALADDAGDDVKPLLAEPTFPVVEDVKPRDRNEARLRKERSASPKSDASFSSTASREIVGKLRPRSKKNFSERRKYRLKSRLSSRSATPDSVSSFSKLSRFDPEDDVGSSGRESPNTGALALAVAISSSSSSPRLAPVGPPLLARSDSVSAAAKSGAEAPRPCPRGRPPLDRRHVAVGRGSPRGVDVGGDVVGDNVPMEERNGHAGPEPEPPGVEGGGGDVGGSGGGLVSREMPVVALRRAIAFRPLDVQTLALPKNGVGRRGAVVDESEDDDCDDEDDGEDDKDVECMFVVPDPVVTVAPMHVKPELGGEKAGKLKRKKRGRKKMKTHDGDVSDEEFEQYLFLDDDEESEEYACPLDLKFPEKLREVLYDDWEKVRMELMLPLGAPAVTVEDIFRDFEAYALADTSSDREKWSDRKRSIGLLKNIFDGIFPMQFLYNFEKPFHAQRLRRDAALTPSRVYGGPALVRVLSRIGPVISFSHPTESDARGAVKALLQELIEFVAQRSETYCTFQEYYYAPPEYLRAYFPPGEVGESRFHTGGGITHGH